MTILTEQILNDILQYLEKSINSLVLDGLDNLEINGGEEMKKFLENQFDIRLENLLISKNSSCLLYTSPSPRDRSVSRMPSSA